MALSTRILALRHSPVLLRLPPYLSLLCLVGGLAWLLLLPLDAYSRQTYISENAILPGQVHTYFGGSEHDVFRAYRHELFALAERPRDERVDGIERMVREVGLAAARQPYRWEVAGEEIAGTNVYGLLRAPRADATEAMVLLAAWRNFDGAVNYSGVALALTLARYFRRWSIWSKDILLLIPEDSTYGPEAWVSAYHGHGHGTAGGGAAATRARNITALPLTAGALQAVVALDYPAGPWGHRFDRLDVLYDGVNGALPNLDLLNTAVAVAGGQMGIGCSLHGAPGHRDTYRDRLLTLGRGLAAQAVGHATGPHSAFVPYHVDALTLRAVGDGWHDEMGLGRVAESLFRSVNNLLEHLHQSFFFYLLLHTNRFVSIGSYLPAAMVVAGSFSITALALWVRSGRREDDDADIVPAGDDTRAAKPGGIGGPSSARPEMVPIKLGADVALVPKRALEQAEREMFLPAALVLVVHLAGLVPLYLLNSVGRANLPLTLQAITASSLILPFALARRIARASVSQAQMTQCFSLLVLGATVSTLATLNFSLALAVGLLCSPLSFVRPLPRLRARSSLRTVDDGAELARALAVTLPCVAMFVALSPPVVLFALNAYLGRDVAATLVEMAKGWSAQGVWTGLVVWGVWWPAWMVGGGVMFSGTMRTAPA